MTTSRNVAETADAVSIRPREKFPHRMAGTISDALDAAIMSFGRSPKMPAANVRLSVKTSDDIDEGQNLPHDKTYICRICGNTIARRPPEECPICGAPGEDFDETQ